MVPYWQCLFTYCNILHTRSCFQSTSSLRERQSEEISEDPLLQQHPSRRANEKYLVAPLPAIKHRGTLASTASSAFFTPVCQSIATESEGSVYATPLIVIKPGSTSNQSLPNVSLSGSRRLVTGSRNTLTGSLSALSADAARATINRRGSKSSGVKMGTPLIGEKSSGDVLKIVTPHVRLSASESFLDKVPTIIVRSPSSEKLLQEGDRRLSQSSRSLHSPFLPAHSLALRGQWGCHISQHSYYSIMTSLLRQNDVITTLLLRHVDGAAPTGDAPTTSEWSTILLPTKVRLILETLRYI